MINKQKKWSENDVCFLKENFFKLGTVECSKILNRTTASVFQKSRRLKLLANHNIQYDRPENVPNGYIWCYKCKQILPESDFYKKTREGKYGKKSDMCRSCARSKARSAYSRQDYLESSRKSPEKVMFQNAKHRSKSKNIEFNITIDDIVIPDLCPILGIKIIPYSNSYNSPSIDRIDNSKGYIKGNIQIISKRANMLKSDSTFEDVQKLYNWYIKTKIFI
jgi:hypothetical protein